MINWCVAIPKARTIPVIIINTNRYNVWIRQPLLGAKLFNVECEEIEYRAAMDLDDNNISVGFQPVPLQLVDINSCQVGAGPIQPNGPKIDKPEFGPRPDTNYTDFDFKSELDQLLFQLNIGKDAKFTQQQQSHFINLTLSMPRGTCS